MCAYFKTFSDLRNTGLVHKDLQLPPWSKVRNLLGALQVLTNCQTLENENIYITCLVCKLYAIKAQNN